MPLHEQLLGLHILLPLEEKARVNGRLFLAPAVFEALRNLSWLHRLGAQDLLPAALDTGRLADDSLLVQGLSVIDDELVGWLGNGKQLSLEHLHD